ncbi:hypothetical protein [Hyphomonas sp.]|uniref:hypothetical protein n=1 Tax=Hyphomonas sp. TaxID=87 RepID=UPI0025C27A11|nr:hypothetical protein [Hyphomonas sp.]
MNNPHKNWQKFLINEAGLNKIRQDMSDYDTAFITAFRGDINDKSMCVYVPPSEEELSERNKMGKRGVQNKRNNRELSAYLLSQGYGVKNVQGSYIENFGSVDPEKVPREVKEASFFVTNLNNDPEFAEQIINLGKRFCQDSVIIVPKGEEGYIYGTNKGKYPGLDQKENVGKFAGGETGEFMSRINSRPFVMKEDEETKTYEDLPGKQRQAAKLMAKRVGEQINDMHVFFEADLQAYDNGGTTTLYHYAPVDTDEIQVDPSQFGKQRYSRREKQRSTYPRSFFYVNLDQAESEVKTGKNLYSLEFPTKKLYSIPDDPNGLVADIKHPTYGFRDDIEWTELFKRIHENYDGAYYSTPNMDLVVLFEPIEAKKMEQE